MKRVQKFVPYGVFLVLIAVFGFIWTQHNAIGDWLALRSYTPPAPVTALADRTSMTPLAKKYFYVNKPELDDRQAFNKHCTQDREQSVVLGCFLGNRNGIFVFNVTTPELDGVREVTAAHEMLHQAYERLGRSERERIDTLTESYYQQQLQNEAIKNQIELYRKSDSSALPNEMHSLFGTQVRDLPDELEIYYAQYFTDRAKVVALYDKYQRAFSERKEKIAAYDIQLQELKARIESLESSLQSQLQRLDATRNDMDQKRASGDIAGYNALVPAYNNATRTYNNGLETLRKDIDTYNEIVAARNAIADQEQALQQNLSSKALPSQAGQ